VSRVTRPQIQHGNRDRVGMGGCFSTGIYAAEIFNREVETRCVEFVKWLKAVCCMGNWIRCSVPALIDRLFDNSKRSSQGLERQRTSWGFDWTDANSHLWDSGSEREQSWLILWMPSPASFAKVTSSWLNSPTQAYGSQHPVLEGTGRQTLEMVEVNMKKNQLELDGCHTRDGA